MKNYIKHERSEYIDALESIRHLFRPKKYRFILAESLVLYFAAQTTCLTDILKNTNRRLKEFGYKAVSLGFIRNVLNR